MWTSAEKQEDYTWQIMRSRSPWKGVTTAARCSSFALQGPSDYPRRFIWITPGSSGLKSLGVIDAILQAEYDGIGPHERRHHSRHILCIVRLDAAENQ